LKILYYDCFAGISGDMNLGALIDLGADTDYLLSELGKLKSGPYQIQFKREFRREIGGTRCEIVLSGEPLQAHTDFKKIKDLISTSNLSEQVKKNSLKIFRILAEAEAKIHGQEIDEVVFHEIGAIDSIIDIVGAAICLENLKVDKIFSSPVQVGSGFVKCSHGIFPVPAPATAEILKGIPIRTGSVSFEAATPTGAAILAATVDEFTDHLDFIPTGIGYGIGMRDLDIPNVLRVFLGNAETVSDSDLDRRDACLIETNIDDMSPESYDLILETLFEKGAQDVYLTPIIMKKSRPAIKISILCDIEKMSELEEVLWKQTTTFGLRYHRVSKLMLKRDISEISTKFGKIPVKNAYYRGKRIKVKPEYEFCKALSKEKGISILEIMESLQKDLE